MEALRGISRQSQICGKIILLQRAMGPLTSSQQTWPLCWPYLKSHVSQAAMQRMTTGLTWRGMQLAGENWRSRNQKERCGMGRITVNFRPEQLDDVITALRNAADDEAETAEIIISLSVWPNAKRLKDIRDRQSRYARIAAWLEHLREEAET
nr:MAG TPA: hypothetical protein [Caudoviricetes sp.]